VSLIDGWGFVGGNPSGAPEADLLYAAQGDECFAWGEWFFAVSRQAFSFFSPVPPSITAHPLCSSYTNAENSKRRERK